MKNTHVLPTDKPSILFKDDFGKYFISINIDQEQNHFKPHHIYITSNEEITGFENNIWVIKGERIFLWQNTMALVSNNKPKKIILTTDPELINDGVQAIDDEFLEWFVENPSCEYVTVYDGVFGKDRVWKKYIIIPKEEPKQTVEIPERGITIVDISKQETLEEAAENYAEIYRCPATNYNEYCKHDIISAINFGAKWQAERMYSEEEVIKIVTSCKEYLSFGDEFDEKKWLEQYKKKN